MRELDERLPQGNRSPETFSAHILGKSPARNFFGSFPREIARQKLFQLIASRKSLATKLFRLISLRNRPPQNFSAHFLRKSLGWSSTHFLRKSAAHLLTHFLRKSAATKLFQLISSGNRPPQNFFGSFPREIGRHKTFSAHFLRKSAATKLFGSFPQEIGRHKTFSAHFLRKSLGWASTHFLRKS